MRQWMAELMSFLREFQCAFPLLLLLLIVFLSAVGAAITVTAIIRSLP